MTTTPDFSKITCPATRDMCQAIWELGLWDFVRNYDDASGFMYSDDPRVNMIGQHDLVDKHGHSGASFGLCCRNAQFVAKNGVDAFNRL
jgi:hypothetical protein